MSSVISLVNDTCYFTRTTTPPSSVTLNDLSVESVKEGVRAILGDDFQFTWDSAFEPTGFTLFDTLSTILPFTSHSSFFWTKSIASLASMLEIANYTPSVQLSFLIFVYARVLGFLGPTDGPYSSTTVDGSPIEFSWIIPNRSTPKPGEPTRQVRFAIQALHPTTGAFLKGTDVLDYYVSPEGRLGLINHDLESGGENWRKKTEQFLFPEETIREDGDPEGTRIFIGFDCTPKGTLTLRAYYGTACRPPSASLVKYRPDDKHPIYGGDIDFEPLRQLMPQLHSSMVKPLEKIIAYFDTLELRLKPRFQLLATDCLPDDVNRLKIYCRVMEGTSYSDVVRSLTLGGALCSPSMSASIAVLEKLWNALFPSTPSFSNRKLGESFTDEQSHKQENENDLDKVHPRHPPGGLLYYYEIRAGKEGKENDVFSKVYLPARHYCDSDLKAAEGMEAFYDQVGVAGPVGGENGKGWLARELKTAFKNRDFEGQSGIQTYVTFAATKAGWEVTSYLSPEFWP